MRTAEQLRTYYDFDESVITAVDEAADLQHRLDFRQLADFYNIGRGPQTVYDDVAAKRPFEILRFQPHQDYDGTQATVLHTPMATPIDQSVAMRAIRLFGADPSRQLIVVGSPGAIGRPAGRLTTREARRVWNGDFTPTVTPTIRMLGGMGITSAHQVGYSYGADKAVAATKVAAANGIATPTQVLMESAATRNNGLFKLLSRFQSSGEHLQRYVEESDSPALLEARKLADTGLPRYVGGLLRISNLAIARSLSTASFGGRVEDSMMRNGGVHSVIAWGGKSELADDAYMHEVVDELRWEYGDNRVSKIVVPEMHHAGGDNINLHAAIVLEGLLRGSNAHR